MNNLSLGGHRADGSAWSLYETIGGGAGASDQHNGQSGLQVHMTNTRATDLEILESRLPLLVRSFRFRAKSGGSGRRSGGLGLIRELELCSDAQMSLLATRRTTGARGLLGGGPGLPGCDLILRNGVAQAWDGTPTTGVAGDRVRIETPGGGGHGPEPVKQA
jgi:N-methylhydantoinase B/oxoprolinase/acetone carboxylase alpha subunit